MMDTSDNLKAFSITTQAVERLRRLLSIIDMLLKRLLHGKENFTCNGWAMCHCSCQACFPAH